MEMSNKLENSKEDKSGKITWEKSKCYKLKYDRIRKENQSKEEKNIDVYFVYLRIKY